MDDRPDTVADTIGFLLARIRGDTDTAMAILGAEETFAGPELLVGMTDLAFAMAKTLGMLVGTDAEDLVKKMAMGAKFMDIR